MDSETAQIRDEGAAVDRLRSVALRPTRQRIALCRLLFAEGHRHVTAEALHLEAEQSGIQVSLATVYNTLHQFRSAGLVRQVMVDGTSTYFDTNTHDHAHYFFEDDGQLEDAPQTGVVMSAMPPAPDGMEVAAVDVIVRLRPARRN